VITRAFVVLALVLVVVVGCARVPCEQGPPVRGQFLLVNDVYELRPDAQGRGGLARVATLVRELRRQTPHTLFVLAGDTLSPSLLSTLLRGQQMVDAWNLLGLDAATFGNHEFDWGPALLRERMGESRFRWVSSNVRERATGRPFGGADPWLRLEWAQVRVGVVGITTPDTVNTSSPGPEVAFEPSVPAARRALAEVGAVELRVAITHLPLQGDRELAANVPLDAILGGHDHGPMLHTDRDTVIMKAGADAINVGQLEYELGCDARVVNRRQRLIPVDARIAEAPDVAALVRRYAVLLDRRLDEVVAQTSVPLDAREAVLRREETPLGRYIAELMRARLGAEVGLLNGGAIRSNRVLPAGPLTRRDIQLLLPFTNIVVLVELSGAGLLEALEHSVAMLPAGSGRTLQTAGLRYEVDHARPVGRRVSGVQVQGHPIDPGRRYEVATIEYLARGGDGYGMLERGRLLIAPEDGPALIETVLQGLAEGRSP